MKLSELLGDPSWLFDLGFPVHPMQPLGARSAKPDRLEWELGDAYKIPALSTLGGERQFADLSIAWGDEGLFLQVVSQAKENKPKSSSPPTIFLTFYLDTRWSPGVHRGTSYCHRFEFIVSRPSTAQLVRGHGELASIQRARAAPNEIHPKDISVGCLQGKNGLEIKAFLKGETLTGYEPREYQELGLFYVINDASVGSQCMARNRQSPFFEDPSQWCRGKLVQPS